MREAPNRPDGADASGFVALGIAALAIGCCAGVPLIAALAGGVAVGTLLGVGAGILAAIALIAAMVLRTRARRRASVARPSDRPRAAARRRPVSTERR